jgi:hypothetical protein
VKTHSDNPARSAVERLQDLERKKAELERNILDTRAALDRRRAQARRARVLADDGVPARRSAPADAGADYASGDYAGADYAGGDYAGGDYAGRDYAGRDHAGRDDADDAARTLDRAPTGSGVAPGAGLYPPDERTAILINRGRSTVPDRHLPRWIKAAILVAILLVFLISLIAMLLPGPGPTWPASVAKVQGEVGRACLNPDVRSEPGLVNFACAKATRPILWVFALMTSGNDPRYAQAGTGRMGLEPISPAQGNMVAWSLNLHHPYRPSNPIDSLEVAARAINNIIGGGTSIGAYGSVVVVPGLESSPANCLRYTGSSRLISHKGFPSLCAMPVSSQAGQAALVADVYQKWASGATPRLADNAATLFENARNPGNPQVQAILKQLPHIAG